MADTQRSLADLVALLADNAAGDISAQDVRDLLVSLQGGYGGIYLTGGATIQALTATPALLTNWTGDQASSSTTPAYASSQVAVGVTTKNIVQFAACFVSSAAVAVTFEIRKNGSAVTGAKAVVTVVTTGQTHHASISAIVACTSGDVITVYASSGSATNLTVGEAQLTITRIA